MLQGLEITAVEPLVREALAVGLDAPALRQKLKPFVPKGELAS
jgi:hypothetical protein